MIPSVPETTRPLYNVGSMQRFLQIQSGPPVAKISKLLVIDYSRTLSEVPWHCAFMRKGFCNTAIGSVSSVYFIIMKEK
jgi:hypothetical protein